MKKSVFMLVLLTMTLVTLTGCLYPQDELAKNKIPNEEQLEMVQTAVLQYMDETDGLLPIKTKDNDVDDYEKYLIDFNMLKERQLISEPPGTAYENGGVYQYGVVTPEEDPRVKLIDLRITEAIRSVNIKLNTYRNKHTYPPYGEEVADGLYEVNYDKLGMKKYQEMIRPYSQNPLQLVMNTDGDLYVDYSSDLQQAIDEYEHDFEEGDDIRSILVDHYPFMPAYSMPYTIKDNEVEFLETSN